MALFEVWTEGFRCTGEFGTAQFYGKFEGETFRDAVYNYIKTLNAESQTSFKDNEYGLRYWGCRFFDNEKDARENYG